MRVYVQYNIDILLRAKNESTSRRFCGSLGACVILCYMQSIYKYAQIKILVTKHTILLTKLIRIIVFHYSRRSDLFLRNLPRRFPALLWSLGSGCVMDHFAPSRCHLLLRYLYIICRLCNTMEALIERY